MDVFTYTAWLQDAKAPTSDAESETTTRFNVIASNSDSAHQWGDKLAKRLSSQRAHIKFLKSEVEFGSTPSLPTIIYGHNASDAEIGW